MLPATKRPAANPRREAARIRRRRTHAARSLAAWREVRRAMAETDAMLQAIRAGSDVLVAGLDAAGDVLAWNARCEQVLGVTAKAACGQAWEQVSGGPEREPEVRAAVGETLTHQRETAVQVRRQVGDRDVVVQWRLEPLAVPSGGVCVLAVGLDISDRAWLERQLVHSERLATLGRLVAEVAHELNNPLTTVLGLGELLRRGEARTAVQKQLDRLVQQAGRCREIVRSLLSVARERSPRRELVCMNRLAQQAASLLEYEMGVANVEVAIRPSSGPTTVEADRHQLHQVVLNLLTNAYQALVTVGGGGIDVHVSRANGLVSLAVADDGPGVPEAILGRVFEPFVTTKADGHGTGLGLSVSKGIVEAHGGALVAANKPEGGAIFKVSLLGADGFERLESDPNHDDAPGLEAGWAQGRRVLVLDDEEPLRLLLAEIVEDEGFAVDHTEDPHGALRLCLEQDYDLVISDLRMPGLSGEEFYAGLSELRPELAARVLFITGDVAGDSAVEFLARVANPAIEKPFGTKELLRLVRRMTLARAPA